MFTDLLRYILEETELNGIYLVKLEDKIMQFYIELDTERFHGFWGRLYDEFDRDKILLTIDFNRQEISMLVNNKSERVFNLKTLEDSFKNILDLVESRWLFDYNKVYGSTTSTKNNNKKIYYLNEAIS